MLISTPEEKRYFVRTLVDFMEMTSNEVLNQFRGLTLQEKTTWPRYMYIPGPRPDRVLLVAHIDTVWGDEIIRVKDQNGILYSYDAELNLSQRKADGSKSFWETSVGIGADDRVGCAMLWHLRKSGHSILLNENEEIGLGQEINARDKFISNQVLTHKFAMEFDRGNATDLIFYNGESKTFKDYITRNFSGYSPQDSTGSTDVAKLCKKRIPAVNVSVGYRNAHKPNEYVIVDDAIKTLNFATRFLKREQSSWYI